MDFDYSSETITPDNTSILTIGGTGGFELPIGNTAQRPSTGLANGALRYNTDISDIEGYINSAWTPISTGATSLTLTGDVTGSGTSSIATTLATVNANVGTFASVTVNGKGLVTAAANLSGDITSSGAVTTLATVNSNIGTYTAVTVNAKGLATAASNMTASGDASGTASGVNLPLTLATVNSNVGTFTSFTVNGKGLITAATNLTASGDVTGTASSGSIALTLGTVNSNTGTYASVTVNGKGLVTAAANLSGDITTSGSVATLPTVNSNVGTFAIQTINGKGLVTAAQNMSGDITTSGAVATLATVNASPVTAAFQVITTNGKGLVTSTGAVTSGNITTALGYTPVNKAGDSMTGTLTMDGVHTVTGLPTPVNSSDAVPLSYVQSTIAGLEWKDNAMAASTAALTVTYSNGASGVGATLTNAGTQAAFAVDGYTTNLGDRILIKNQASALQNGIYTVTTVGSGSTNWVLTRAIDSNTTASLDNATLFVTNGTANGNTGWTQTVANPTVGTNNVTFVQFSGSGTYTAGTGLSLTGNTFANTGVLSITGTANQVVASASTGAVTLSLPQSINSGAAPTFAGTNFTNIPNSALTNSSITVTGGTGLGVSGSPVALGGTVTLSNTGVTSAVAGTGITVSGATGAVTIGTSNIPNASLANSSITLGTTNVALGATATTLTGLTSVTSTGVTVSGLTANSFLYSGTSGALTSTAAPTNGQLLIGSTGAAPVAAALTAGTGISVTNGAGAITIANTGVTSVALALPSIFTVSGSPVTTTGTLTGTLASQTANTAFLAPNGSAGAPTFRALAYADLPLKLYVENPSSPTAPTATGTNAIAFGNGTTAAGTSSEAHGLQSNARVYGQVASSSGEFSHQGDSQNSVYMLRALTTNATQAIAYLDGSAAKLTLPTNSAFMFDADIVCRRTDSTGTYGAWNIKGLVTQDGTVGTTAIQGSTSTTKLYYTPGLAVTATADTTGGALQFNVTGLASQTIRWSITVRTTEVTN